MAGVVPMPVQLQAAVPVELSAGVEMTVVDVRVPVIVDAVRRKIGVQNHGLAVGRVAVALDD
jgi:hypothetical protein